MSRLAKGLLILAVLSATLGCFTTENTLGDAPLIACGVFSGLFLLTLALGRKIKFDPVLR
ncbi:PA3371 family protein [Pseudomonas chlororaphis]|uniref:PA3371 family protein n=1 Tax=Pseudomonas chlororaphis TaxID=587753 RepID=UPI00046EA05F|nr:PA3371 family protein [Pseudomonas chlororaphis]